ncbi:phenylalanine--tRNA ligase subunit alpha, partial [Candidatus Microgenomates bacterium]|nr:phenylalanine--tRNA ligase subunit alpha [Candidatus Microgenomates bacterium]
MQDKLIDIKNEALSQIIAATESGTLEEVRIDYLGKSKGKLTEIMKKLPTLPPQEKAIVGRFANEVKKTIEDALDSQIKLLQKNKEENIAETEKIDVTLPGIKPPEGHNHPVSLALHDVLDIFKKLGYQATETHEIENDFYNFTSLNMGPDAPSRDT